MANRRFIIQVGETYYMTTGPLLAYDASQSKGNKKQEEGAAEVAKKFAAVDESARYAAVEVTDSDFAAANFATE